MKMNELIQFGFPAEIITQWKQSESVSLLPVQERAVREYGLFEEENLLIQAPTSSGKTFVGEMAAVRTALRRKKVIYLVPLKALAEEKYADFKAKYEAYGIKVILSTRDHRESDGDLAGGDFSIAVVVYEKLYQLLIRRPERIEEIALVVADELEVLSDVERGASVDVLFTRIVRSSCRLIGMSAVIGEAENLATWMRARLLRYERRPVELRYGVLHDGVFRYKMYNDCGESEEPLVCPEDTSPWGQLRETLRLFSDRGESSILFVKSKHEARMGAHAVAREVTGDVAVESIAALEGLEDSSSRAALLETLQAGAAFHSSDLTREERGAVEAGFRMGEIRTLVSTSTLAVGLNMPSKNVFVTTDKWCYDERFGTPWKSPILKSEYDNMSGRAGRYGIGHEFGRSILIAPSPFDAETLWRRYIDGICEGICPRLNLDQLEDYVLQLVASRQCRTAEDLVEFLESTLAGQWVWRSQYTAETIDLKVRFAIHQNIDKGVLAEEVPGQYDATPIGYAIASKGIRIDTAVKLERWLGDAESSLWTDAELVLAACRTPDGRMYNVMLTAREYDSEKYTQMWSEYDTETAAMESQPFFEDVRSLKVALILLNWMNHAPVRELEENFNTTAGQIQTAAEQIAWVLDAAAALAKSLGVNAHVVERIESLSFSVHRGLHAEAMSLVSLVEPGISRTTLAALVDADITSARDILDTPETDLKRWFTTSETGRLKSAAAAIVGPEAGDPVLRSDEVVLKLDERHPGTAWILGSKKEIQHKQYQLLSLLARRPGECVRYETIYDALWGEDVVESNQIHYQKRKLHEILVSADARCRKWIRTVPKHGFVLELPAHEIELSGQPVLA
jgi:ATP-dependent DNA helicase